MTEFTFLFRGRDMAASPQQMQATMQRWTEWFKELAADGHITDPGHPLEAGGMMVSGRQKVVTDGPYAEAKDLIGGYIVVQANSLAHAAELAKGCPIFDVDGSVEIRPLQMLNP